MTINEDAIEYGTVYAHYTKNEENSSGRIVFSPKFAGKPATTALRVPSTPRSQGMVLTDAVYSVINSKLVGENGEDGVKLATKVGDIDIVWQATLVIRDESNKLILNVTYILNKDVWVNGSVNLPDLIPNPGELSKEETAAVMSAIAAMERSEEIAKTLEEAKPDIVAARGHADRASEAADRATGLSAAKDSEVAAVLIDSESETHAAFKTVGNATYGTKAEVQSLVADALAADSTVAQAAAAAAATAAPAAVEALTGEIVAGVVPPINFVPNLWVDADSVAASMGPTGGIVESTNNLVSPFIPVTAGSAYRSTVSGVDAVNAPAPTSLRIVWFDEAETAIAGTDTNWLSGPQSWVAPTGAAFVRIAVSKGAGVTATVIFNKGTVLTEPSGTIITSEFWQSRELPPLDPDEVGPLVDQELAAKVFTEGGKIPTGVVDGAVPKAAPPVNWYDLAATTAETMGTTGDPSAHASHRLTPHLPVEAGETYLAWDQVHWYRIVWFNASQAAISGTDTAWSLPDGGPRLWTAPANAVTARMVVAATPQQPPTAWFGPSPIVFDPAAPPDLVPTGFWEDRELPPMPDGGVGEEQLDSLRQDILSETDQRYPVSHFEPSTPTLTFTSIYTGWAQPFWLTADGTMIYGGRGGTLEQSADEWYTRQVVHEFPKSVGGVRELADGELLVATLRDNSTDTKAKLYKSSGYDRADPTAATWTEVMEAGAANANINNAWGLQVHGNVVIACEYGLRDVEGSRRVWMSEDHGDTWTLVFDQMTIAAPGRPVWTTTAHLHGAAWDPYWNRLWVICGDNPNTATYYSDDKGQSWTFVTGSEEVQYTGIMPLPDVVLFGSDRAPNGLHVYRRGLKSDMPKIRTMFEANAHPSLTQVWQLAYKRDWSPTTPTYFPADPAGDGWPSVLTATVDGKKGHLLWEGEPQGSGLPMSGRATTALGPTAQGNIVMVLHSEPGVPGFRVLKGAAPTWARV